ncbi:UNVERIFIED_ORG: hypothetical protein E4P37_10635 [Bacillus sp. AZ43]
MQRRFLQSVNRDGMPTLVPSRKRLDGGLYVFGLCGPCNSSAGRWDDAYGELALGLRSCRSTGAVVVPRGRMNLPSVKFSPSAIARSILMGFFGVNHVLRNRFPELAAGLLAGEEPLSLPEGLRLRVAIAQGTVGRLTGAMHSMQVLDSRTGVIEYVLSDAAVYFPPLAWQLTSDGSTYLDGQGWGDASSWLSIPLADRRDVRDLCPSLPLVLEPSQDPEAWEKFVHLFSDELTPIVECSGLLIR